MRLPDELAAELAAVARTRDVPISEVIRQAIETYLVGLLTDEDFQQLLKQRLEEDRKFLERFAK